MQIVALLGRQPLLGAAELERVFGSDNVRLLSASSALVETDAFDIQRLGGTLKAGRVILTFPQIEFPELSKKITQHYVTNWSGNVGKQTVGISVYDWPEAHAKVVGKLGLSLKTKLKANSVSVRLIPNQESALSTATSHHNKLGLSPNKVELLIVRGKDGSIIFAESTGAQNITSYVKRDQERPKRDAFVGMLPPKLAQTMINLASPAAGSRVLDPFCGTGVILQEALLMGYNAYGTDLSDKMIDYSEVNLSWLEHRFHLTTHWNVHQGDAIDTRWKSPIDAVATEAYLGQPFSAPPSPAKLADVRKNCNYILSSFLKNIGEQLASGTPLCVAVPAWRDRDGYVTHLPLVRELDRLGYTQVTFNNLTPSDLLYYREDQTVARELLVIIKK
ncbi:MAG: TRM11 family SAM-dependent methyltransferase [Candidatus Saccharimonadales bacterium]